MKANTTSFNWTALPSSLLGLLASLLVFAVLTGRQVPLIADDRAAFITLAVLGFAMCSIGMGKIATGLGWLHPVTIAGIILGVSAVLLVFAMLTGWHISLIPDYRAAFLALSVIGLVKWVLAWASRLFL